MLGHLTITYLLCGIVFMGIADILHSVYLDLPPKYNMGWKERLFCIILWPWGLYILIKAFWETHDRNN